MKQEACARIFRSIESASRPVRTEDDHFLQISAEPADWLGESAVAVSWDWILRGVARRTRHDTPAWQLAHGPEASPLALMDIRGRDAHA